MSRFRKLSHSIYECKYHIVFCPKYRYRIFDGSVGDYASQQVYQLARQKDLPISVQIAPAVGAITSDRRRVEQIMLNLLNNAIKFTPVGQVTLTCEADTRWITTRIQDTGIGIAPEGADKLFRAFQQIETGLSRRFEGTGLGLSICKKLVELLGGEIHAHSAGLGQGATFTFTLPAGGNGDEVQDPGYRGQ